MNDVDLVTLIGDVLTQLDAVLMGQELKTTQPAKWQQLFAVRKHLDDEQRSLVEADINSDDVAFKTQANTITAAAAQLKEQIGDMSKIDSVLNIVSLISSNVGSILKIV